ncbi:MAG: HAD-IA family hydrolase [Bacillota bacterium]|nr:HAD-IA family hydrolase [Bacillota bacterium]
MSLKGVLFDFDGTVANTIPGIMATMAGIVRNTDLNFSLNTAGGLIGQPLVEMGNQLVGPEKSADFVNAYFQQYEEYGAKMIEFFPGTRELVEELKEKGILTAVVTSKRGSSLNYNLQILRAEELFDLLVSNDNTIRHKPHPEPVEYALERLGLEKSECCMVGDTRYDILAAQGAGVVSIGVTWGVESREQLSRSNPQYIAEDVPELASILYGISG